LSDAFKEIHNVLSPAEWYKTVDEILLAANFRASKAALHVRRVQIVDDLKEKEKKEAKTKT
jgi:hypothetical protein